MGRLQFLLGIEINQESHRTTLCQKKYINQLLVKYELENSAPRPVPLDTNFKIDPSGVSDEDYEKAKDYPYKSLLGALLWLSRCTRPDISAAVAILSKFGNKYSVTQWNALVNVLLYLKGTIDLCIEYKKDPMSTPGKLYCYADSSFADDKSSGRSTAGYVVLLNDGPVSWYSKGQNNVVHSTTEAEFVAAGQGAKELVYCDEILICFCAKTGHKMRLFQDNTGAEYLAKNPKMSDKSRHIRVKFHFVRELYNNGELEVEWIRTEFMVADLMTKAVSLPLLMELRPQVLASLSLKRKRYT